jgi:lysophospholipase L1-like esterase
LDADVFWVLIGTNDLGADDCSAEAIVAGNIRVVEEIQSGRPNAKIVLNSILPRGKPGETIFNSVSWPKVSTVNRWMECYAASTNGVEFFNATSLFLTEEGVQIEEYFEDPVHPSAAGSVGWGEAIVQKVLDLTSR